MEDIRCLFVFKVAYFLLVQKYLWARLCGQDKSQSHVLARLKCFIFLARKFFPIVHVLSDTKSKISNSCFMIIMNTLMS